MWTTPWVVHAQPAGAARTSSTTSARYLFRVAIANSRLEQIDDDQVTFRYRDNRTQAIRRATLSGVEFLRRFLQHVLPRGCTKVRYYGLWSATRRCRSRPRPHPPGGRARTRDAGPAIRVAAHPAGRTPVAAARLSVVSPRHADADRHPASRNGRCPHDRDVRDAAHDRNVRDVRAARASETCVRQAIRPSRRGSGRRRSRADDACASWMTRTHGHAAVGRLSPVRPPSCSSPDRSNSNSTACARI